MMLLLLTPAARVSAYYDRGPVKVYLGQTAVSVAQGAVVTVSAQVDPASDEQLPGCGMAQCPQECGELGCLDARGQCQCAGTTYQTYYANVRINSADTTVATASYKAGVVSITGVAPGETVVSVTGSMRQFTDTTATIRVTVTAGAVSAPSPSPTPAVVVSTEPPPTPVSTVSPEPSASAAQTPPPETQRPETSQPPVNTTPPETAPIATMATPETTPAETRPPSNTPAPETPVGDVVPGVPSAPPANTPEPEPGVMILRTTPPTHMVNANDDHGAMAEMRDKYIQVDLPDGGLADGSYFADIAGQDVNITFRQMDDSGNVIYSWTFNGRDINTPASTDLTIYVRPDIGADVRRALGDKEAKLFVTNHNGALPGAATVYLRVGDTFQNGRKLELFQYNANTGALEPVADDIPVENGYVVFTLTHCSEYVLAAVGQAKSNAMPFIAAGAAVLLIVCGGGFLLKRQRKAIDN